MDAVKIQGLQIYISEFRNDMSLDYLDKTLTIKKWPLLLVQTLPYGMEIFYFGGCMIAVLTQF